MASSAFFDEKMQITDIIGYSLVGGAFFIMGK
jgi:hypothetical protein